MIDITKFINGNNYFDVDSCIQSLRTKDNFNSDPYTYIETDTEGIMWSVYNFGTNYTKYCYIMYDLEQTNYDDINNCQFKYESPEFYIRSSSCQKVQIFNHVIYPSNQSIEILCKLSDEFEIHTFYRNLRIQYNKLYVLGSDIITDNYQIYDGLIRPIYYLPDDIFIEPQPQSLLLHVSYNNILLTNFFNKYQITYSDIIIIIRDWRYNIITDINIKYEHKYQIQSQYEYTKHPQNKILMTEYSNGDLTIDMPYNIYVQLSWI